MEKLCWSNYLSAVTLHSFRKVGASPVNKIWHLAQHLYYHGVLFCSIIFTLSYQRSYFIFTRTGNPEVYSLDIALGPHCQCWSFHNPSGCQCCHPWPKHSSPSVPALAVCIWTHSTAVNCLQGRGQGHMYLDITIALSFTLWTWLTCTCLSSFKAFILLHPTYPRSQEICLQKNYLHIQFCLLMAYSDLSFTRITNLN